tara:strand:- start:349 stop:585 length:237 start_codon:yes stop_codon:yes gene_type:complete
MEICYISWWLAYGMLIYCVASAYYYVKTRNIGTPFRDSLTKKQIEIKNASSNLRKNIFCQGLGVGILITILFRPFRNC